MLPMFSCPPPPAGQQRCLLTSRNAKHRAGLKRASPSTGRLTRKGRSKRNFLRRPCRSCSLHRGRAPATTTGNTSRGVCSSSGSSSSGGTADERSSWRGGGSTGRRRPSRRPTGLRGAVATGAGGRLPSLWRDLGDVVEPPTANRGGIGLGRRVCWVSSWPRANQSKTADQSLVLLSPKLERPRWRHA